MKFDHQLIILRSPQTIEDNVRNDIAKNAVRGGTSFADKFKQEVKKGIEEEMRKKK